MIAANGLGVAFREAPIRFRCCRLCLAASSSAIDPTTAPYAALVLRLSLGVMLVAHALLKAFVFTELGTVGSFESVGFPGWLAYLAIAAELIRGMLLILGVYAR
jgi:uncharacterized membrane protein YphA (DoxX/SURF4 family)